MWWPFLACHWGNWHLPRKSSTSSFSQHSLRHCNSCTMRSVCFSYLLLLPKWNRMWNGRGFHFVSLFMPKQQNTRTRASVYESCTRTYGNLNVRQEIFPEKLLLSNDPSRTQDPRVRNISIWNTVYQINWEKSFLFFEERREVRLLWVSFQYTRL